VGKYELNFIFMQCANFIKSQAQDVLNKFHGESW